MRKHKFALGSGDINIAARGGTSIITKGDRSHSVIGWHKDDTNTQDDIDINVQSSSLTTEGVASHGIYGLHEGWGDINIAARGGTSIITKGNRAFGIVGFQRRGMGNVYIDLVDSGVLVEGDVTGTGLNSRGVFGGNNAGEGTVGIRIINSTVTTMADTGSAVYVAQLSSGSVDILIDEGSTVIANGMNANAVQVGRVRNDTVERSAEVDEDGYRKQTVTVNGRVVGGKAGVYLAGGGRVVIGSQGSVGAKSGIAILATGDTPGASPQDPPVKPKLRVDMNLDGRRVAQVIGKDWIMNDGGETTIAVNNIVLHEGATGVTGHIVPNGAWNVTMREEGVTVNRDDLANWVVSDPAIGVVADRDFSFQDFTGSRGPMFMEEYAPRAALYEVLPDFMLRMQNWEPTKQRLFFPESPVWIRLLGSKGSQELKHSTVNASYDADWFAVEAGVNVSQSEDFNIGASVHRVTGSADVFSPANGGEIHVKGMGLSADAHWSGKNDYYATGRLSLTNYDIDLSSNTIGRLKSNGDANGRSLYVEAGRRMILSEKMHWTPRAWLGHTKISVHKFTDAVNSRVSFLNKDRFTGGFGVMAESSRTVQGGEFLLRGSMDFEQKFGNSKTVTLVSGERLSAEPEKSSAILSLGGAWHKGAFKLFSAGLSARKELNSGGEEYSGFIKLEMHF